MGYKTYFSQYGEDKWIAEHLALPERGVFVDVGAHDGITDSNTYHFERRGWTGLCIDGNPEIMPALARNRATAVHAAIGSNPTAEYWIHPSSGLSGFGRKHFNGCRAHPPIRRLDDVLRERGIIAIDLLSIDVEARELDVWSTFDHNVYRPRIVVTEYTTYGAEPHLDAMLDAFYRLPYRLVKWTEANLIYERLA